MHLFFSCVTLVCVIVATAAPAAAQPAPPSADVARLQAEVNALREEVAALRASVTELSALRASLMELSALRASLMELSALRASGPELQRAMGGGQASATFPAQVTPAMIDVLKAQIEEQAQVKVESASRMPVHIFGTILSNTFVNSSDAIWIENPNFVGNPSATLGSRGSMSATARQSRIGLQASGITVGGWQASGTMIADFYGGVPGFSTGTAMGLPRLLYAFGRLETDRTALEIGQDHAILAPRDPTSLAALSFPLLYRSGNLYLRTPQVRVERSLRGGVSVTGGIVAPLAGDAATDYEFAPPPGAGERSMRPAFEGRVGFARGTSETPREVAVGASGHYGWRRPATDRIANWVAAFDFSARSGRFATSGEIFTADNAEAFGAGISQAGKTSGGWMEGRATLGMTTVTGGLGIDRPADALGRVTRQNNRTTFGSAIVQLTPELAASLEYRWMRTELGLVPVDRTNHHVNAVFAVKF
jgi:hypothetical protein